MKPRIAVSIGDPNGVGPQIALAAHRELREFCEPVYCAHRSLLGDCSLKLGLSLADEAECVEPGRTRIPAPQPGEIAPDAGEYSFQSFALALELAERKDCAGVLTLPISKAAWRAAGLKFKGHTDYMAERYARRPIMMLGCDRLLVSLFTDHVPLKDVPPMIREGELTAFLLDLERCLAAGRYKVLGLNPHAGEAGVLGGEDAEIAAAVAGANARIGKEKFTGPLPADSAFANLPVDGPEHFVAMYHDQGLIPVKTLFFDESVNISLNLPVLRSSVDHGTAFDIAYTGRGVKTQSYLNAARYLVENQKSNGSRAEFKKN